MLNRAGRVEGLFEVTMPVAPTGCTTSRMRKRTTGSPSRGFGQTGTVPIVNVGLRQPVTERAAEISKSLARSGRMTRHRSAASVGRQREFRERAQTLFEEAGQRRFRLAQPQVVRGERQCQVDMPYELRLE